MVIALGLVGGLSAGPIMSLPGDVLSSDNRALWMGVFHTLYYVTMLIAPAAAGRLSEIIGTVDTAFGLAAVAVALCLLLLVLARVLARRAMPPGIAP